MLLLLAGLVAAAAAPGPAPPPVDSLSWLPANTQSVTAGPGPSVPLVKWLLSTITQFSNALGRKPPACWSRVTAPVVASYQVWSAPTGEESAVLVQGHVDRVALMTCIDQTMRMGQSVARLSRTGAITQVDTPELGRSYIGWTPSWTVWHRDRARVAELLAATKQRNAISPTLAAALTRCDRSASMWFGSTLDYSTAFLGVSSRSISGSVDTKTSDPTVHVIFEYASADDATRAAGAVATAATNAELAPEIRTLARDSRATARDRLLELELSGKAMLGDETMAALKAWIDKKKAEITR